MKKNSITNKITPCCGLPFSVIYWWVSNLTLKSESDRQFIISKISQNGIIAIDGWKVLINSGTLEADASLTKAEFLAWFDCGKQPKCEQLKILIESFQVGNWTPETELPSNLALIDKIVNGQNLKGNVYTKEQVNQLLTTSFGGDLVVSDNPQPTSAKWYFAKESGTYPNAGGLVVDLNNKLAVLNYDGTTWSKVEVAMPNAFEKSLEVVSNNLFDKSIAIEGAYVSAANGEVTGGTPWFTYIQYIPCKPNTFYVRSYAIQVAFFDIDKNFISGNDLGEDVYKTPANCYFMSATVANALVPTFVLNEGTVLKPYDDFKSVTVAEINIYEKNIIKGKTNQLRATRNALDYNSIRDLVKGISDASESNKYEIIVPKGIWKEFDWHGKKHVKIIGEEGAIIKLDSLGSMATNIVTDDLFFGYAGEQIQNIPKDSRHIVFLMADIWCENLTFDAKDAKYAIHIDFNARNLKGVFKNCHFIEENCNVAIGMGVWGSQNILFENCVIESKNVDKHGITYHNWNNQKSKGTTTFLNCKFENCSYAYISELGSEQIDEFNIINCFTTLPTNRASFVWLVATNGANTVWINPATGNNEPYPQNVPYCIKLNTSGTFVGLMVNENPGAVNPAWAGLVMRDIEKIKKLGIIKM